MSPKTLVVSFDCANAGLLDAGSTSGSMPALGALRETGTWARTRGFALSAESDWHSFYAGCEPGEHGHIAYDEIVPGTYRSRLTTGSRSIRPPFFQSVAETGDRVVVLNPVHVAAHPVPDGTVVTSFLGHETGHVFPVATHPPELALALAARFPDDPVDAGDWGITRNADPVRLLAGMRETLRRKTRLLRDLVADSSWRLAYLGLDECHEMGHLFWHLHDAHHPRHREAEEIGIDPLSEILRDMDAALAEVLVEVPRNCLVVVVSIAGIAGNYHWSHLVDTLLSRFEGEHGNAAVGYSALREWWGRVPPPLQRSLNSVRHRVRERLLARSRRRRRAFATPLNEVGGGIRLNLVGREPRGLVDPADYDATCARLIEQFESLTCAETGARLVRGVTKTSESQPGPFRDRMPDLVIDWNVERPIATATSPFTGVIERTFDHARTGHHVNDGVLLFAGDGEPARRIADPVRIADIGRAIVARHTRGGRFGEGMF